MKKPQVSIITVNLNGKDLLKGWFTGLYSQNFGEFEVILVDNGSSDGSCNFVKKNYPATKLIVNKTNLGFAKACNQGAELAKGKCLFFLNNDAQMDKFCLERLVSFMEINQETALVGSAIFKADKKDLESAGFFPTLSGFFIYPSRFLSFKPFEVFGISGVAMLVRKKIFDQIGGFDSSFFVYSEDADLCTRVKISGGKILVVPEAKVYHLGGQTAERLGKSFIVYHSTKNRILLLLKNFSLSLLVVILPIHLLFLLLGTLSFLFFGKLREAKSIVRGIFWNLKNISLIFKKRKKVQALRVVPDWIIFKQYFKILPIRYLLKTSINYLKTW